MRSLPPVALVAIATLAACAPASAATTISPAGVRSPQVAIAPGGRTIVAWERSTRGAFGIEARVGPGPRHLGPRMHLAVKAYSPKVAVGADGTAAVMWMQSGPGYRTNSLRVAVARPGHGLGAGQLVDRRRGYLGPVGLAVQPNGRVVAVWTSGRRTAYALAPRGHGFGAAADISPAAPGGGSIATDPRDGAVVLPYPAAVAGLRTQVAAAVLTTSAARFAPQAIAAPPSASLGTGAVAVTGPGGAGIAYAVFGNPTPSPNPERRVVLVRRRADGSWAPAELVAAPQYPTDDFVVDVAATLSADGSALAAWSVQTDDPAGLAIVATRTVAAIAAAGGAGFGMPVALTPAGQRYSSPSVAATTGAAFVATARPHGPVLLSTRPLGAPALLPATTLAPDGDGDVELAAGGRHAVAVYQVHDRLRMTVLR